MSQPNPQRELTLRAIILGAVLSVVMGAANVYLGLRVGLTVSASIPAAVISMIILRHFLRNGTILESNQVQTAASAGESLAAGVIFTLPALILIQAWTHFDYWMSTAIALAGGILGVLFMIPMRKVFVVNSDSELTYPEGVACAEVLRAGGTGAEAKAAARAILVGGVTGAILKFSENFLHLIKGALEWGAYSLGRIWFIGVEALPALIGVGYILRFNLAANLFLGGALSWLVFLPLMSAGPAISELDPIDVAYQIWSTRVRFIGVGAMLVGGIFTLWRVRGGLAQAVAALFSKQGTPDSEQERSLPMKTILFWSGIAVVLTGIIYLYLLGHAGLALLTTVIMLVAGFFFTAVASYIVGLVGNSNSPVSGMTITAVLFTALLLMIFGFEGMEGMVATLGVAAIVCCIACTAGDVCNDLKTGALVGATPWKQQVMQIIGVCAAAFFLSPILQLLHEGVEGGIGGPELAAPQAALFASLVQGFFGDGELDYMLLALGALLGVLLQISDFFLRKRGSRFRTYVMPVAVGMYLPMGTSSAMLLGGLISAWTSYRSQNSPAVQHRGMLLSSGLIAGEAIIGILLALLVVSGVPGIKGPAPAIQSALTFAALVGVSILIGRSALMAHHRRQR